MRAVILDRASLGNANIDHLLSNGDRWEVFDKTLPSEVAERISGCDIVLSNKVPIDAKSITSNSKLKLILVMATGTNNVDIETAKNQGVAVCNVRGYGTASVAQHTLTLMLSLTTMMPAYLKDVRQGAWQQRQEFSLLNHPITELDGKTLGIVGYGELGKAVAKLAKAFGMQIMVADRTHHNQTLDTKERYPLETLLPKVDFLTLHCPLDSDNYHFLNARTLGLLQPHSFLINTARGGLIDSQALVAALGSGKIAGAALDTLEKEPPENHDTLLEPPENHDTLLEAQQHLPNLLITPHNAWGAIESRQRLVEQLVKIISRYHSGEPINLVC